MSIKTYLFSYAKSITLGDQPTSPMHILSDWSLADARAVILRERGQKQNKMAKVGKNMLHFFKNQLKSQFLFLFRPLIFKVKNASNKELGLLDKFLNAPVFLTFEIISRVIEAVQLAASLFIAIAVLPLFLCMKAIMGIHRIILGPYDSGSISTEWATTEETTQTASICLSVFAGLFFLIFLLVDFAFHCVWRITFLAMRTVHQFFAYTLRPHNLIQDIKDNNSMSSMAKGILTVFSVVIALLLTFAALTAYGAVPFMPAALTVMPLPLLASALISVAVCYVTLVGVASLIHGARTYLTELLPRIFNSIVLSEDREEILLYTACIAILDAACGYVSVALVRAVELNELQDGYDGTPTRPELTDDNEDTLHFA